MDAIFINQTMWYLIEHPHFYTRTFRENTMETRIIKNISNKTKEDVGISKPQKHANKVEN